MDIIKSPKAKIIIAIVFVIITVIALFLLFSNSTVTEQNTTLPSTSENIENEETKGSKSLLSKLLGQKIKVAEYEAEEIQSVDLHYTIEPGENGSIAHFYVSSVATPVQGIQMLVHYSDSVTPLDIDSTVRFPDLVKKEINSANKTIFALTSIGKNGQSVTGSYPIFSVIFEGENPKFTIDKEKTIIATEGKAIPFNIIDQN